MPNCYYCGNAPKKGESNVTYKKNGKVIKYICSNPLCHAQHVADITQKESDSTDEKTSERYYTITDPFFALIRAASVEEAQQVYHEHICDESEISSFSEISLQEAKQLVRQANEYWDELLDGQLILVDNYFE